jgi:nicotinamidase-related amidase
MLKDKISGLMVPETLGELVDPARTAVLVIDIQNDYCHKNGAYGKLGIDLTLVDRAIGSLVPLLGNARKAGVKIVYTKAVTSQHRAEWSPAMIRYQMMVFKVKDPDLIPRFGLEGTWGAEILDDLRPEPRDVVITKHRSDSFQGTMLAAILKSNRIDTIVLTGAVTEGCVEATARSASQDYHTLIVKDCVASNNVKAHEIALEFLALRYDMPHSGELIRTWGKFPMVGP